MIRDLDCLPSELVVAHEHGLGDHFLCNGLVNWLSQRADKVYLPTYDLHVHPNYATVKDLYRENTRVQVVKITDFIYHWEESTSWQKFFDSWQLPVLQIRKPMPDHSAGWYHHFYNQIGLDYRIRYSHFHLPRPTHNGLSLRNRLMPPSGRFRLVHAGSSTSTAVGMQWKTDSDIDTIFITPGQSSNLLDWVPLMYEAEEIHALQSSVFWLVDSLPNLKANLYYHDARTTSDIVFKLRQDDFQQFNKWIWIYYDTGH